MLTDLPSPSLTQLALCIRKSPESWRGISMLHTRLPSESLRFFISDQKIFDYAPSDALLIRDETHGIIMLGTGWSADFPIEAVEHTYWFSDIADDWQEACGFLEQLPQVGAAPRIRPLPSTLIESPSILVIENDTQHMTALANELRNYGAVTTIPNDRRAVMHFIMKRPDIVFLDIQHYDRQHSGFELLSHILEADEQANVVCIAGHRRPAMIMGALSMGACGFIYKPVSSDQIASYFKRSSDIPAYA